MIVEDLIDFNPFEKENKPVKIESTLDELMNLGFEEKVVPSPAKQETQASPFAQYD